MKNLVSFQCVRSNVCNVAVKDVGQTEIHTAELIVPEPSAFDVEMSIEKIYDIYDIQGVTGGTDQTSGECSSGHTIPI